MKRFLCGILSLVLLLSVVVPSAVASVEFCETVGAYGDVNMDYSVNAADALDVLLKAVGKKELDAKQTMAANVDGSEAINAVDALMILQFSVRVLAEWPLADVYDAYELSDYEYVDPDDTYTPYKNSGFGYDTSLSVNGAYAVDTTADNSFVIDNTGLAERTFYTLTANVFASSDIARLVYSLQGIINRDFGRDDKHTTIIYTLTDAADTNWMNYMMEEGSVYEGYQTVRIASWEDFYNTFEKQIKQCGIVLWDGNVPATANVAGTICGLDGYLPVLAKSPLHDELVDKQVAVKQSLVDLFENGHQGEKILDTNVISTGSAKNDAYRWAMEKYFNRCSSNYLAYILDGAVTVKGYDAYEDNPTALLKDAGSHCLPNHDYLIARRCFFFDLSPYQEEICDDPAQQSYVPYTCPHCSKVNNFDVDELLTPDDPLCAHCGKAIVIDFDKVRSTSQAPIGTDHETMMLIYAARYERANGAMGQLMGFPPWWLKYTTHGGQGTKAATWIEWLYCEYITCYNLAKEADAAQPSSMTNGSAYYKYVPLQESYDNNWEEYSKKQNVTFSEDTYYYTIYVGDYDSSAWLKTHVNTFWVKNGGDRARKTLPLTWCFNPNLSNRVPMIFDYIYANKYEHEFIAAGDSGAGYVIPAGLYGGDTLVYARSERPAEYTNGDTMWALYCKKFYERFDIKATGFIINGSNPMNTDIMGMFNTFSPMGSFHNGTGAMMTNYKGVPYIYLQNGIGTSGTESTMYNHIFDRMAGYNFAGFRTVCHTPSQINSTIRNFNAYAEGKGKKVQYLELYTLLDVARQSGQGYKIG